MTPKEKAKEIYLKYRTLNLSTWINSEDAKKMSLIAVEMVILNCYEEEEYYWKEVKQEIEKL